MVAGYVRLSKDDEKRNYISIENQKLIIRQFAQAQHISIDCWYEDDGFSGYKFDRPGFCQMITDLDNRLDTVIVKDFSRLGRHNAKVLLLLDEFQERGKRLIVIDDHYDSFCPDDDSIGIKTWYNEKYVKDTSKKIKHVLEARQKEGTLLMQVPFGYKRNERKREEIEIISEEAKSVKLIYQLYLKGYGYRKIASYLTEKHIPTPSLSRYTHELIKGRTCKRLPSAVWSDSMIKNILDNDFYIGTYRLHKRARATVHGKDKRVPKEEQYLFQNHHPPIIDKSTYDLAQEIKSKRIKTNYRGSKGQWLETTISNPFANCLFCKDCKKRLTPIIRKTSVSERKYFMCSTYNTKGRSGCPASHIILERDLMEDIINYIYLCYGLFQEELVSYSLQEDIFNIHYISECTKLRKSIQDQKGLLKALLEQRLKDSHLSSDNVINESYTSLQNDILNHIHRLELQYKNLETVQRKEQSTQKSSETVLSRLNKIILQGALDRNDIDLFIERIEIDRDGCPDIQLRHNLSSNALCYYSKALNQKGNHILYVLIQFLFRTPLEYISANALITALTKAGYPKTPKIIQPYIKLLLQNKFIESTNSSSKPYKIIQSKEDLSHILTALNSFPAQQKDLFDSPNLH